MRDSNTMMAAVFERPYELRIEERPVPELEPNSALIRVTAAGICGSDLPAYRGEDGWVPEERAPGGVMGHEFAGEVAAVGDNVDQIEPGARVWVDPCVPCRDCDLCRRGRHNLCENMVAFGHSVRNHRGEYEPYPYGGFEEFVLAPASNLYPLPDSLEYRKAALLEPLSSSVHLLNKARPGAQDSIAIFGAGTMGLLILQVARAMGCGRVFSVDLSPGRLELATALGADVSLNPKQSNPVEEILDRTGGNGVDVSVEAVGRGQTYKQCVASTARGGTMMGLGNLQGTVEVPIWPGLVNKEIEFLGCHAWEKWEPPRAIELLSEGRVDVDPLITHELPLEEIHQGFDILDRGIGDPLKVLLLPRRSW